MTLFIGIDLDNFEIAGQPRNNFPLDAVDEDFEVITGTISPGNKIVPHTNFSGVVLDDPSEVWFDNIIVEPILINFGFIVAATSQDFLLWSTYRRHEDFKTITQFQENNFDGLVTLGVVVPKTVTPQCALTFTVQALLDGSPVQASTIVITIGGEVFTVVITGKRIVAFPFLINWARGYDFEPSFETVINTNIQFVEQRRPLLQLPLIRANADITLCGEEKEKGKNAIRDLSKKTLGLAYYQEPIILTSSPSGSTLNVEDTSDFYYLRTIAEFLMLIDRDDIYNNQILEIDSQTDTTIDLVDPINITATNFCLFPIYIGTIKVRERQETDGVVNFSVEMREN